MQIELEGEDVRIAQIQREQEDNLFGLENVVGIGVGRKIKGEEETDEPCLSVLVAQKVPSDLLDDRDRVPKTCKSIKTDVVEAGEIFAGQQMRGNGGDIGISVPPPTPPPPPLTLREPADEFPPFEEGIGIEALRTRRRPAEGGYSVGHVRITAGTIATGAIDQSPFPGIPRRYYLLSNNHVLANSNNARLGDPILQPGPADGGRFPRDVIGRLSRFVPIRFGGRPNYVDAAIAEVNFHDLDRSIFWIGVPRGKARVRPRDIVQKTGRTTSYTTGRVTAVNASVNVNYGGGRVARFVRQIVTTNMSAGGDSGSLVLDRDEKAIGLLFAGSSRATILNPIDLVESQLGVRVGF